MLFVVLVWDLIRKSVKRMTPITIFGKIKDKGKPITGQNIDSGG